MNNKEEYQKGKEFTKSKSRSFKDRKFSFGKSANKLAKASFKRKKLEVGSPYTDRELGEGTVTALIEESITVCFGEQEKIFPRRRRPESKKVFPSSEKKVFGKREYAKDDRDPVFKFDQTEDRNKENDGSVKRSPVKVGLHVKDDVLGPGVVGRITERGTYVTYERTGEFVLYPLGLPLKLIKSAFPEENKNEKKNKPQRSIKEARTYKVSSVTKKEEKPEPRKEKSSSEKIRNTGDTRYFELTKGTRVLNKGLGAGTIKEIGEGILIVDFSGEDKKFSYPEAFILGELEVSKEQI